MPPKLLDAWLADFVKNELTAVITWKQQMQKGIKPDPDSRFSDDGSNLRSEVRSPPATANVQLIEVLTSQDVVTAYVCDGIMKVKVRFSRDVVVAFEEDSGGPLDSDVKGDVFRLVKFTVVSTPFGPADGFVQLHVDEIKYETLRRGLLDGLSVERDFDIRTLIESTKLLRVPENAPLDVQGRKQAVTTQLRPTAGVPNSNAAQAQVERTQQSVQTQAAPVARPRTPNTHATRSRAPVKRKAPGPTLSNDGFEVESGVNLYGPVEPINREPIVTDKQAVNPHLLSLLGGNRAPGPLEHPSKGETGVQTRPAVAPQHRAEADTVTASAIHIDSSRQTERADNTIPESSQVYAQPSTHADDPRATDHDEDDTTLSAKLGPDSVPGASSLSVENLLAYARRKIPGAQRKLLDDPSSWLPPLPGRQFPRPNVPMELLSKWNAEAATSHPDPVSAQDSFAPSPRSRASLSEVLDDSDSESEHGDDATQEYPPSPEKNWLPRQAAIPPPTALNSSVSNSDVAEYTSRSSSASPPRKHRPHLPPSSTVGSVIRGTPLDGELEVAVPRPLPVRHAAEKRKADEHSPRPAKRPALSAPQTLVSTELQVEHPQVGSSGHSGDPSATSFFGTSQRSAVSHRSIPPRQCAPTSPLPGLFPGARPPTAPSTPYQQPESISQTSTPLDRFRQGRLSQQPPRGPRSSQAHMYQDTRLMQGLGSGFRNRAHELHCSQRVSVTPLQRSGASPLANSPAEILGYEPSARSRQARNNKVLDITDPATERVSSSVSPQQDSSSGLPCVQDRESTLPVLQSPVVLAASNQLVARSEPSKPPVRSTLFSRKAWLKANYIATQSGNIGLQAVLENYRKSFPNDTSICIDDLLEAARYAFDGVRVTPDMRYIAKSPLKTSGVPRQKQPDAQVPAPVPSSSSKEQAYQNQPTAAGTSPPAPQHPGQLQRQMRIKFINEERRKVWLQTSYVPSKDGTVPLETLLKQYQQACPEDEQVQPHTLLSAAELIYNGQNPNAPNISASTLYSRKLESMGTARNRITAKHAKTGESVYEQARRIWINANYEPDRGGPLQLATIMARYKNSCPDDDLVEFEDFLRSGVAAWPDRGVTPGMPWRSRAESKTAQVPKNHKKSHVNVTRDGNDRACHTWLKMTYEQDGSGQYSTADMFAAYTRSKTSTALVNESIFQAIVSNTFGIKKRRLDRTAFRAVATNNAAGKASTNALPETVGPDVPPGSQEHYHKVQKESRQIDALIGPHKHNNYTRLGMKDQERLEALHHADGSIAQGGESSRNEHDSRHGALSLSAASSDDARRRSECEIEPGYGLNTSAPDFESTSSIEEFCAAYLAIRPGNGNAFGKPLPKSTWACKVDVLKWDIL
ncbi:Putative shelterin complex subunit TPP1/Est3 [Septoria linicola]|uniref:Shelterin complex subunit TPP1/Est3 n=1 Tax=Septoria linicola TaxID=215465 RepID=A0A9Q9AK91_9PEZI|nr:Putative shelterin complex subunit TPP1/Est3 [Septoria linicola]